MSQFKLTVRTGNVAVLTPAAISLMLQDISAKLLDADEFEDIDHAQAIMDANGNRVGQYRWEAGDE